ncbi:hypothetical protein T484DRAFT_1859675 [Baffinella frigidus]|nr:hypothetical protein T484DRAFT_1859675 [Cryptophyta sp. CCMP2293]
MGFFEDFARDFERAGQHHVEGFERAHLYTQIWAEDVHRRASRVVDYWRDDKDAVARKKAVTQDTRKMWALYHAAREGGHVVDAPWGLEDAPAAVAATNPIRFVVFESDEFLVHASSSADTVRTAIVDDSAHRPSDSATRDPLQYFDAWLALNGKGVAPCAEEEDGVGLVVDSKERLAGEALPDSSQEDPGRQLAQLVRGEGFDGGLEDFTRLPASGFC